MLKDDQLSMPDLAPYHVCLYGPDSSIWKLIYTALCLHYPGLFTFALILDGYVHVK